MKAKQFIRLGLSITLAGVFVWLIISQINPDELRKAFADTNTSWLTAALTAFGIGYTFRIQRWRLMLTTENPRLSWLACAGPFLASFATNNVLPFRAGDVLRAFAFNGRLGTSASVVLATLFVERLLDLLMVILLLLSALLVFQLDANRFAGLGRSALAAIATGILLVMVFPQLFFPVARITGRLATKISPRLGQKLSHEIDKILTALSSLAKGKRISKLLVCSVIAWLAEGCVFWFSALALPALTAPEAGWLALPVGTLATLIPSTPGYIGTFDYFTGYAMTALGNSQSAALGFALLVHVLLWLPPTIVGGLYLALHPSKPKPAEEINSCQ